MTDRNRITLNIRYDLPEQEWSKVLAVYRSMEGWIEGAPISRWYGSDADAKFIEASVEPGGIVFEGVVEPSLWTSWLTVLCARLTHALGREIHDAEW